MKVPALCHTDGKKDKPDNKMVTTGVGVYTGETSRSLKERAAEHTGAARGLERGSHMVKHWFLSHPERGVIATFQVKSDWTA